MNRFEITSSRLQDVSVLRRRLAEDERGTFERLYDAGELSELLGVRTVVQVNRSLTRTRGTVRGMHYQLPPAADLKLVTCMKGSVFDVAVDLRRGSPTFLEWHSEVLAADVPTTVVIPEGCAHGFQALSDECELLYLHTARYSADHEARVHPLDPLVGVAWPEPLATMSARDRSAPFLSNAFTGVER